MLVQMAPSATVKAVTAGGFRLQDQWAAGQALDEIRGGHYDFVVLQEQSQTPVLGFAGSRLRAQVRPGGAGRRRRDRAADDVGAPGQRPVRRDHREPRCRLPSRWVRRWAPRWRPPASPSPRHSASAPASRSPCPTATRRWQTRTWRPACCTGRSTAAAPPGSLDAPLSAADRDPAGRAAKTLGPAPRVPHSQCAANSRTADSVRGCAGSARMTSSGAVMSSDAVHDRIRHLLRRS